MKKLNNKGFTLIELLATVVIMLAISVMAISSITAATERSKEKQNNSKKDVIISYAKLYYESHLNTMSSKCVSLSLLDLSDQEKVDADGNPFIGVVKYDSATSSWTFVEDGTC